MSEIFSEKYEYKGRSFVIKVFQDDQKWEGRGFSADGIKVIPNTGVTFGYEVTFEMLKRDLIDDAIEEIVKMVEESLRIQVDQESSLK